MEEIRKFYEEDPMNTVRMFFHEINQGKGAALRTGFQNVQGNVVIIQDADLEYDPNDYPKLIRPIIEGKADVVYGSRYIQSDLHRVVYFWHTMGNKVLTFLSNCFTNLRLTDMETCYKVFRRECLEAILPKLQQNRFGFEPEVTTYVARGKTARLRDRRQLRRTLLRRGQENWLPGRIQSDLVHRKVRSFREVTDRQQGDRSKYSRNILSRRESKMEIRHTK